MNRSLKLSSHKQKIFFSSDFHLNHNKPWVVQARGFQTIEEHNDAIFSKVNELVGPNDVLFHLGDFCLNTTEEQFFGLLGRFTCQNIINLWGNHPNPIWKIYQTGIQTLQLQSGNVPFSGRILLNDDLAPGKVEIYPYRIKNMVLVGNSLELFIDGIPVVLCHYPLRVWNFLKEDAIQLSGHSHYNDEERRTDYTFHKALDVGWDGHQKPLSWQEILTIMDKKEKILIDHHGK